MVSPISSPNGSVVNSGQSDWSLQLSQLLGALGQNQYKWAMDQFNQNKPISDQNISQYLDLANGGAGLAQNLISQYKDVFEPLMNDYIRQAGSYNSDARKQFMMGQAESTVAQADQAARNEAERKLQGFGINPNSGRYQDLMLTSRIQDAAARAGAGTQAALNTSEIGRQMTEKAAQMGQNVPGMAVNALQSAYTGVTGAENALLGMLNTGANITQSAAPFFNAAGSANKLPPVNPNPPAGSAGVNVRSPDKQDGGRQQQQPQDKSNNDAGGNTNSGAYSPAKRTGSGDTTQWPPMDDSGTGDRVAAAAPGPDWLLPGGPGNPLGADTDWSNQTGPTYIPSAVQQPSVNPAQDFGPTPFQMPSSNPLGGGDTNTPDWGNMTNNWSMPTQQDPQAQGSPNWNDYSSPQQNAQPQGVDDWSNWNDQSTQSDNSKQDYSQNNNQDSYNGYDDYGDFNSGSDYTDDSYAAGGRVRGMLPTSGGQVSNRMSPSRGRTTDDVPARLNAGEFVMPRDVVADKGTGFFKALIEKSRRARTGMSGPAPRPKMRPALNQRPNFVSRGM